VTVPLAVDRPDAFGVYVHVPFCRARCDYCAFATWTDQDHLIDAYVAALHAELAMRADELRPATSVYVGGGTPSRIDAGALGSVISAIVRDASAEVTVECNPEDVDGARLAAYREAGVTRISLGVQSTRDHVLRSLGRRHGTGALDRVAALVHDAGFATWSVDLVFGAVAERDGDLAATLEDVLALAHPPPHVSAYALTPEPGTPLGMDPARHPDEDALARRYEAVDRRLGVAGYRGRRSRAGRSRATRRGTTGCTGPRASTSASGAPRTATEAACGPGTSGRRGGTSSSWAPDGTRPREGRRSRRRGAPSRRWRSGSARATACRRAPSTTWTSSATWSSATGTASCSRCAAGCSRTR